MNIKALVGLALVLVSLQAWGDEKNRRHVFIEGVYGTAEVQPGELNDHRSMLQWNNTTRSDGAFDRFTYFGGSIGFVLWPHVLVSARYEEHSETLLKTQIKGSPGVSVTDSFVYHPILLNLDVPFEAGPFIFTMGVGAGYASKFEFHQTQEGAYGEDITWMANPLVARARVSVGLNFTEYTGLFVEAIYEKVESGLSTDQSYQTTLNNRSIQKDQQLANIRTGELVTVDMSGWHYGAGLRIMF